MIEICTDSLELALKAQELGAGRIELCSGLGEGGLSPSAGLIEACLAELDIPVRILIRPRPGDFHYSQAEYGIMKQDILRAREMGAEGVVFGLLHLDGRIDRYRCLMLREAAGPMGATFHRAFDLSRNPSESLEDIIECGFDTLLTSGQANSAQEGIECLAGLVAQARDRLDIMPGSGIRASLFPDLFWQTGARVYHATLTRWRESGMSFRRPGLSMAAGSPASEYLLRDLDEEELKRIVKILRDIV